MVANDTVISYEETQIDLDEVLAEPTNADKVSLLRTQYEAQAEISFKAGREEERKDIIEWLRDLGADEYMIAKLNNEMIIKSLSAKPN